MKRTALLTAVLGVVLLAQAAQAQWTTAKRLTWNSGRSDEPDIAVDPSGNIHVVWDDDTPSAGYGEIYHRKSTDGGATWTPANRLTWTSDSSSSPVLAVDAFGHLHLVWHDYSLGYGEIFYKKSMDGGETWQPNQRLTWTSGESYYPAIAVESLNHLNLVWSESVSGNWEIYHKKSTDGGASWTPLQRLTWSSQESSLPAIAVDPSGKLCVAWTEYPSMDNDGVNAADDEIYFKRSDDAGITWTPGQRLTWTSGESSSPVIAVDSSGRIHVLWYDSTPGNYEIYHKKSTDSGASWSANKRLTWNAGYSRYPDMAFDSFGDFHVVWSDATPGNWEVFYKKSPDAGATWSANQALTWNSQYSEGLAMAVDSFGNVHVVWDDYLPGNSDIYYKRFIR